MRLTLALVTAATLAACARAWPPPNPPEPPPADCWAADGGYLCATQAPSPEGPRK